MAVFFKVDSSLYTVGHGDFLHSFFSTISYRLEPNGWGTKYPYLIEKLYGGELAWVEVPEAINELNQIQEGLARFGPEEVIWDIEDLNKRPPWGDNISADITNLSNYFITSNGKDLFSVLLNALNESLSTRTDIEIVSR